MAAKSLALQVGVAPACRALRNLSTTLRQRRLGFTEQAVAS